MKLEFLSLTGIKKESSVLFLDRNNRSFAGLFGFKMRANKKFFYSACLTVFQCASTVTRNFALMF